LCTYCSVVEIRKFSVILIARQHFHRHVPPKFCGPPIHSLTQYMRNDSQILHGDQSGCRAGLRHRPTRPRPRARGFRGPALSKVEEMCRHSYSLSHEKSEKMFWIAIPVLSRSVSGINGDFRRKSPIIPTPAW